MEEPKKFTEAEIVLGSFFLLALDGLSALLDLTGIGLIIAPVVQAAGSAATTWWLHLKGDAGAANLGRQLTKYIANFLPLLPTLFIVFLIEVYVHNHPNKFAAITKATRPTSPRGLSK